MMTLLSVLYVLHLLLVVFTYRLLVLRLPEHERGILTFICLFSALLPLFGEVLGGIAYLISRRFASSDTLLDYDEYVQFDVMNLEGLQQQAADNMEMVPIKEALNMDAKRRKQSMIHLTTSSLKIVENICNTDSIMMIQKPSIMQRQSEIPCLIDMKPIFVYGNNNSIPST